MGSSFPSLCLAARHNPAKKRLEITNPQNFVSHPTTRYDLLAPPSEETLLSAMNLLPAASNPLPESSMALWKVKRDEDQVSYATPVILEEEEDGVVKEVTARAVGRSAGGDSSRRDR